MAHTNETAHYHLPQYVGTDIINPLDDTNKAYEDIDTALYEQGESIASVGDRVTDIETELNASGGISDQVQTLTTDVSNVNDKADANAANITALQTGLSQTNTTVSGIRTDVNSLSSTVSGHTTSINSINSSISSINTKNTQQDTAITNLQNADTALGNRVTALENAPGPTVDTSMSGTSTNAVQNKVIKTYVDNADTGLGNRITTNTNSINNKNNLKLYSDSSKQIRFGIDGSGNYGYYKDGADSVTPFKSGGVVSTTKINYAEAGTYIGQAESHSFNLAAGDYVAYLILNANETVNNFAATMDRIFNGGTATNAADSVALDKLVDKAIAGSNATVTNGTATRINDKSSFVHINSGGGSINVPASYTYGSNTVEWELIYLS